MQSIDVKEQNIGGIAALKSPLLMYNQLYILIINSIQVLDAAWENLVFHLSDQFPNSHYRQLGPDNIKMTALHFKM